MLQKPQQNNFIRIDTVLSQYIMSTIAKITSNERKEDETNNFGMLYNIAQNLAGY